MKLVEGKVKRKIFSFEKRKIYKLKFIHENYNGYI